MLGLSALALTTSLGAAGIGTSAADQSPAADDQAGAADVASLAAAETTDSATADPVAQDAPRVPALEVGATPLGARRPVALDGPDAQETGTLPGAAAYAYTFATSALEKAEPRCGLRWSLLAAIGRIESDHGRAGASRLSDRGVVAPAVRSARLDGSAGTSKVADTDAGDLDGDSTFDRAVGPMQLLPSAWGVVGVDADGDGKRNPDDIDDAALGAAVLLCGAPGRLTTAAGVARALERYNTAPGYADAVTALEREYRRTGVPVATLGSASALLRTELAPPSASLETLITGVDPAESGDSPAGLPGSGHHKGHKHDGKGEDKGDSTHDGKGGKHDSSGDGKHGNNGGKHDGAGAGDGKGDGKGGGKGGGNHEPSDPPPSGEPSDPPPSGEPTDPPPSEEPTDPPPSEEPTDPPPSEEPACAANGSAVPTDHGDLTTISGTLTCSGSAWSVGGTSVVVGDGAWLADPALADFDGDGVPESNLAELTGLVGVGVVAGIDGSGTLWTIGESAYLPAPAEPSSSASSSDSPSARPTDEASASGSPSSSATG
jgi:membrane-bound lytic murein transglycosylase B